MKEEVKIKMIEESEPEELKMSEMMKKMKPFIWPKSKIENGRKIRGKVILSAFLILGAKLVSIITPLYYKDLIDALSGIL